MKTRVLFFQAWILCAAALSLEILHGTKSHAQPGAEVWVARYGNAISSEGTAQNVVVDADGNAVVVGYTIARSPDSDSDWLIVKYSNAGAPLWTHRYNGPGNGADQAKAAAVDTNGNVYVTGYSDGVGAYPGDENHDYTTIAYSSAGVPLWTNRYNGPGNSEDKAVAVAVDGDGDVIVTGFSSRMDGWIDGPYDYATVKYSSAGAALWTNRYTGPAFANALAVDGRGNVFVTGTSATVAYSSAGDLLWTNLSGFEGTALAVDGGGDVIVVGSSYGSSSAPDYTTIKYSGAGVPLWTNLYDGPVNGDDRASAVAVDSGDNIIVTGSSVGSSGYRDYATVAYSSTGVALWTNRYHGPAASIPDLATAVEVDGSGNVFVTGYSWGSQYDFATIAYSKAGEPLWTNRFNGSGNGYDIADAVAVEDDGNVFVTGYSTRAGSGIDFTTIKYSGTGVPLWTNRYNELDAVSDQANAVAADANGNVYVTGNSYGTTYDDYATLKYSGAGAPLWTNRYNYNGPDWNSTDVPAALAVEGNGNAFVTGHSFSISSYYDFATTAYSSAGATLWTRRYDGPGNGGDDYASGVAVDGNGDVFVTGTSYGGSGSRNDYAIIAYSNTGAELWTRRYNGPGDSDDYASAIAVDGSGNVFVTGNSGFDYATIAYSSAGAQLWLNRYNGLGNGVDYGTALVVDSEGNVLVTGSANGSPNYDYATIKYSGAGVPLWTNVYSGPGNADDQASAVAADASGNVFVTGRSVGGGSGYDYATIAYSRAGVPLWTNRYNGPGNGNDYARMVVADRSGNVVVTGYSLGSGSGYDYATIAYSNTGVPLWTNRYNGPGNGDDIAEAMAVDDRGNAFVTGRSLGSSGAYDYATIKYAVSLQPPPELVIQQTRPDAIRISWTTNGPSCVLESKDRLSTNVSWTPVMTPVGIEGSNYCTTNRTDSGNERFYRLRLEN